MRRAIVSVAVAAFLTGCSGGPDRTPSPTPSATVDSPTPSPEPTPTPVPEPSPGPDVGPDGMPLSYAPDDEPGEVPSDALVPDGATVIGQWFAFVTDGVRIAVAWTDDPEDADRVAGGIAVWSRTDAAPHWRASFVRRQPRRLGVTSVEASTADLTGDGSDDLLFFEGRGGSGACGTWFVIELLAERTIYRESLCDGRVEPAPDDPGLLVTESVFEPGDAHCCPSAIRRSTLVWTGSRWRVSDRSETPT